jgi:hypothetical protein
VSAVYRFNDKKEQKYGSVYVEQIINIARDWESNEGEVGKWVGDVINNIKVLCFIKETGAVSKI